MASTTRKLQSLDEDDIVRYSMGDDVPIVGLVRDRLEYREMREMAVIFGAALGLPKSRAPAAEPSEAPAPEAATPAATVGPKPQRPVN